MQAGSGWTREQLLIAFKLYSELPFGRMHSRNAEIVKYAELIGRSPSALAMKLTNIASLDPIIRDSGRTGLVGASANDRAMWDEMQSNWEEFAKEIEIAQNAFIDSEEGSKQVLESDEDETTADYTGHDRSVQTTARVGQNFFRRAVLSAYDSKCCISGLSERKLLVASHIVPWRIDPTNRLNPRNGLCLSILHDRAFDLGIITIDKNMTVRISKRFSEKKDAFFNKTIVSFAGSAIALPEKFAPTIELLEYHRQYIFEG